MTSDEKKIEDSTITPEQLKVENEKVGIETVTLDQLDREAQQQRMQILFETLDNNPFKVFQFSEQEIQDLRDALAIAGEL